MDVGARRGAGWQKEGGGSVPKEDAWTALTSRVHHRPQKGLWLQSWSSHARTRTSTTRLRGVRHANCLGTSHSAMALAPMPSLLIAPRPPATQKPRRSHTQAVPSRAAPPAQPSFLQTAFLSWTPRAAGTAAASLPLHTDVVRV